MKKRFSFIQVLVYYGIAILLSLLFRVPRFNPEWYLHLQGYPYGWILFSWLRASGPLAGGIISLLVFQNRYERTITLAGLSLRVSVIYFGAPVLMVSVLGIAGPGAENPHLYGFLSGLTLIVYCLFEETGWRGFLQDALRDIPNPFRFMIIGTLWYLWHLNLLSPELYSVKFGLLVHLPSCILGSWIIGLLADKYKSIMVAAAAHCIFNIFFDLHTDMKAKMFIVAGMLLIWMVSSHLLDKTLPVPVKRDH